MSRVRPLWLALLLVALPLCGCQAARTPDPTPTQAPIAEAVLLRVGVEQELAPLVAPAINAHRRVAPEIVIDLSSGQPDQLVDGIAAETLDLVIVPRLLQSPDMLSGRPPESMLASDLVVLIVHAENQVAGLSSPQAQAMLSGRITSWSDLKARAGVPEIVVTPPGSSLITALEQTLLSNKAPVTSAALLLPTGRDIVRYVAEHPQAIGVALQSQVDESVRVLTLDGQAPTWEAVAEGDYALALGWEPVFATYAPGEADVVLDYIQGQLKR